MVKEASASDLEVTCPALVQGLCHTNQFVMQCLLGIEVLHELGQALSCQLKVEEGVKHRLAVIVGLEEVRLRREGVGFCQGLLRGSQLESRLQLFQVETGTQVLVHTRVEQSIIQLLLHC